MDKKKVIIITPSYRIKNLNKILKVLVLIIYING